MIAFFILQEEEEDVDLRTSGTATEAIIGMSNFQLKISPLDGNHQKNNSFLNLYDEKVQV